MSKYINKTQPTNLSPIDYINSHENISAKNDCIELLQIFEKITGYKPILWDKIIGFGTYHYKSKSSEGDWFLTGFAPRASTIAIYIMGKVKGKEELEKKLGKFKISGSCLHIKKLADIDLKVLEEMIQTGVNYMQENYELSE